jgi:hypothetical protein
VILDVAGPPQGSGGQAAVLAGLVQGPHDYIVACFDAGADASHGTVSVDVMVGGRRTRVGSAMADLSGVEAVRLRGQRERGDRAD